MFAYLIKPTRHATVAHQVAHFWGCNRFQSRLDTASLLKKLKMVHTAAMSGGPHEWLE